jgi:uncharacterized protein DUF6600/FecR-like protein
MDRIKIKIWPHATLIVLGCAIVAGAAALFWTKYERTAEARALPNAARIERVDGQVGLNHSLDAGSTKADWIEATANTPITIGDRVYARDNSRSEIAFSGRNFATIDANTSLDILDLSQQRTQVALRDGSALFDIGSLASGQSFEVATPCGAVDLEQPGIYQIALDQNGNAVATTLSGAAQVVGQGGSGRIDKGEVLTIPCQGNSGAVMSRVDAGQAGALLDNHFRYRYPRKYDGRYRNYYTYLDDPNYYDPYRSDPSYNYVSEYIPGVDDLDDYGDWQYVSDYGYCWHPRVDAGWVPYQSGNWSMDYPFGLTWVSNEPWGYAPYHYGRWAYASNQWLWVPEPVRTYPTYSPALVAFIPLSQASVAWVPLGPGDPYSAWYYDPNWQPIYLNRTNVIQERIVNINVPGAVTVVDTRNFNRVIDTTVISRVDSQTVTRVRPVLDPLAVDSLRRAAFETHAAQRRISVPPAIARRIDNTPVVTGTAPSAPPFRRDLARALRVESVPDRVRNQKLQFRDERAATVPQPAPNRAPNGAAPNIAAEQARERQIAELARRSSRGDRSAQTQVQELRRQQVEQQRAERATAQQAQGERVRQQMQTQGTLRQQQRQPEIQRAQQPVIRHSEQQQRVQPQPQPERRRPPVQYQPQAPRQAPAAIPQPQSRPQVMRQQERRAAPQQMPQVRPVQPQPRPQPQVERQQKQAPPAKPVEQRKKPPEARQ